MHPLTSEQQIEMLRRMMAIRYFDEAASEVQSQGLLPGPMHTSIGQEAEVVGACMALRVDDYMLGNHRSHGHPIGKGAKLGPLMAELLGRATGVCSGKGGSMHLADFSVGSLGESGVVGAGMPIATGAALSAKLRGTTQVALSFFGDGGANTGPFHESLNLAAIWSLPVIFLCENNGYAVTTSAKLSISVEDVSTRALSYDIPGVKVDGQDAIAVYTAVMEATERARAGDGPTLLDVKTYRYHNHAEFGGMENGLPPYRTDEELQSWINRDPIVLLSDRLVSNGVLEQAAVDSLTDEVKSEVASAVDYAKSSPFPEPSAAYEGMYVNSIPVFR